MTEHGSEAIAKHSHVALADEAALHELDGEVLSDELRAVRAALRRSGNVA